MNERIRELAEQATKHYPATATSGEFSTFDKEKFAELIVKECAELTRWKDFDMSVEQRIRFSVYQDIKEHFGVEK